MNQQQTIMLEVDVESNDIIRLTEPLTPQADDHSSWDRRPSSGYENSRVLTHLMAGIMTLFILAAVVFFNRQSLVQCDNGEFDDNATNVTILEDIVKCNATAI